MKKILIFLLLFSSLFAITDAQKKIIYYPMGKKIYQKVCKKINLENYKDIKSLQKDIKDKKLCKRLSKKWLLAVSLYLWDIKRVGKPKEFGKVIVHKGEKCPVCGMLVYKYPRWAAQIYFKKEGKIVHFSFDGVKDMMKFYFNPDDYGKYDIKRFQKSITKMVVNDYYTQKGIDAKKAYYVIGSNVLGPMGNELIPFKTLKEAQNFKKDHFGKTIKRFDELNDDIVWALDGSEQ
jgi:nitrous oxide reductase accessory protein NosL